MKPFGKRPMKPAADLPLCKSPQLAELVPFYIVGIISEDERDLIEHHLGECEGCQRDRRIWQEARRVILKSVAHKPKIVPGL